MKKLIGITLVGMMSVISCQDRESPTAPALVVPPSVSAPLLEPTEVTPEIAPDEPSSPTPPDFDWKILDNEDVFTIQVDGPNVTVSLACYEDPDRDKDTQVLFSFVKDSPPATMSVDIPCEQWQCDLYIGSTKREPPYFQRDLIVGRIGTRSCSIPPPPTCEELNNCPPPECEPEFTREVIVTFSPWVCREGKETRSRFETMWEINSCTGERRELWTEGSVESRRCEEPPECETNGYEEGLWQLHKPIGDPAAECSHFGFDTAIPAGDREPDFYVHKCGLDYFISASPLSNCPGSDHALSHRTACVELCVKDD